MGDINWHVVGAIVLLGLFLAQFIQAVEQGEVGKKEIFQLIWPDSPNTTQRPKMPSTHVKFWIIFFMGMVATTMLITTIMAIVRGIAMLY